MKKYLAIGIVVVAIALTYLITMPPGSKSINAVIVEKTIRAAAILENNEFDSAISLYQELVKQDPHNSIAKKNLAIAQVGKLQHEIKLASSKKTPQQIREAMTDLVVASRKSVAEAIQARANDPICYQLDSVLEKENISMLGPNESEEVAIKLAEKLRNYASLFPKDAALVMQLFDAVEFATGGVAEQMKDIEPVLIEASEANPRNLYMLSILIGHLARQKDSRAFEFATRFIDLLRPFRWQIQADNRGNDFNELESVVTLSTTKPDEAFRVLKNWIGIAKVTSGHSADVRLAKPNVLATIDLSDVEKYFSDLHPSHAAPAPSFESILADEVIASGVIAFDWNIDTVQELVTWNGTQLSLSSLEKGNSLEALATLEMPYEIRGVVPVDLFVVRAGPRSRPVEKTTAASENKQASSEMMQRARRHDTLRDLLLFGDHGISVVKFETPESRTAKPIWSLVDNDLGLSDLKDVTAVLPVDWDADGDLDLVCIANGNKIVLRQNKGNRTFEDVNSESILPGDDFEILAGVVVDFDRDVDLDVVLSCKNKVGLLENILHGQFRFRELDKTWQSLANAGCLQSGEFDGNYSWDYVAPTDSETAIVTTRTTPSQTATVRTSNRIPGSSSFVTLRDWNNDGLLDAMIAGPNDGISLLVNSEGKLADRQRIGGAQKITARPVAIDFDQNGMQDFATIADGKLAVFRNTTTATGNYSDIRCQGIFDDASGRINHFCIGTIVEVFSPAGYQARIMEEDHVHFGFANSSAYNLRVIFPNGLTQNTVDPPKNQLIEEIQIPKGSCPFLYGWDGQQWALVTDLLWNAPLGLQYAKGKPLPDRRWEHLLLSGTTIQPHDGSYELRVTEELWESAYFDHVALGYVDHPAEVEVHSNEKVGPPSIATPGVWFAYRPTPLQGAKDKYDRDWTDVLSKRDRNFAIPFKKRLFQGLVEEHWLEFDFGTLDTSKPLQLYLTGWIFPTDTSLNMAIDQNPEIDRPAPPSLWTVDTNGNFQNAIPFTGFPGGKPKTIVIPLDGVFASDDHRIRIQHSSEIYWDQAFVAHGEFMGIADAVKDLAMQSATLEYRGFSKEKLSGRSHPHWYDYNQTSLEPNWPPMSGRFTRLGDITNLLKADDDHLVVLAAGDEMRIRFALPTEPLKTGWIRDFVMHNVGWDKDADLNTLEGQSSLPLPFSKMDSYPPPVHQHDESARIESLHRDTLTREQDGNHFWRNQRSN